MKGKKRIFARDLERGDLADFLRRLADGIEGRGASCLADCGIDLHSVARLKLGLLQGDGGTLELKIKVREQAQAAPQTVAGREAADEAILNLYRPLKRRMKATFAAIGKHIAAGETVPGPLLASFLADSREMVGFPGFGDACYAEYLQCCSALEAACRNGDGEAMRSSLEGLAACKRSCHQKFK